MRRSLFLLVIICLLPAFTLYPRSKPVASIPFEMVGTYVVLKAKINNSSTLNLILDTGVRCTIITELFPEDSLSLNYSSYQELQGLGGNSGARALYSDSNTIVLNKKLKFTHRTAYYLENNFLNLSQQTGYKINGLLGADCFRDYIVQIDYTHRKVRFYQHENFEVPKGYGYMPMIIDRQKMYIQLSILETDYNRRNIKMLIDSGAELTAWFQTLTNNAVDIPEKSVRGRLGEGLSGEINGVFARVPQICIANFCVKDPIVAFPDSSTISEIVRSSDRDGTIGSQLLSRFNLMIDTHARKFYFKPNSSFKNPFSYNIAGIEIARVVYLIPQIEIINIWKSSPAEKAGLQTGDIITEINYEKTFGMTAEEVRNYFNRSRSKPLNITVNRNGAVMNFKVEMKAKI